MTADRPRYAADDLRRFVTEVFVRLDVPQEDARVGAETLVHADLLGIDSHGVATWLATRVTSSACEAAGSTRARRCESSQGVFLGAWQVEAFLPMGDFTSMLDKALGTLRETPPADGHDRVLTPGEREWSTQEERSRLGIPLHPTVAAELREEGAELGVGFPSAVPVPG